MTEKDLSSATYIARSGLGTSCSPDMAATCTLTLLASLLVAANAFPRSKTFYCNDYFKSYQTDSRLEDICPMSKATLKTLLRGLVAVLVNIFPECCPRQPPQKVRVYRQIMSCPGPMYPVNSCYVPIKAIPATI